MQRNEQPPRQNPRQGAEKDASQAIAGQPRTDDEDDELQQPETVPSFFTAREFEAWDPAKGERRAGSGEPPQGLPERRTKATPPRP